MSSAKPVERQREETPVDDVRRVREELSAQFGNDVAKLVEHARSAAEAHRTKLGLQRVVNDREAP